MKFRRKSNLESETIRILLFNCEVLIESKFYVGEVGHINDVENFRSFLLGTFLEEGPVLASG